MLFWEWCGVCEEVKKVMSQDMECLFCEKMKEKDQQGSCRVSGSSLFCIPAITGRYETMDFIQL